MRAGVAVAIGGSIAAHLVILAGLRGFAAARATPRSPSGTTMTQIELVTLPTPAPPIPPPAPTEEGSALHLALPSDPRPPARAVRVAPPARPPSPLTSSPSTAAAIARPSAAPPGAALEPATAAPTSAPSAAGSLSMRAPRDPGRAALSVVRPYRLPPERSPEIHPPEAPPLEPTGELAPAGGGTFASDRPGFTGKVARDGTVSFTDKPSFTFDVRIPNPVKVARRAAKGLETWYRDPTRDVRKAVRNPSRLCAIAEDACPALPDDDGEWTGTDQKPDHGETVPIFGGAFNPTDAIMRAAGVDPYQSEKLAWMDRTRDERAELGRQRRVDQLRGAPQIADKHLRALWARTDLDVATKRRALFALWDDCAEVGDATLVDAGARARAQIIGFIRAHLPRDSPDQYAADELAALNAARISTAVFAPY